MKIWLAATALAVLSACGAKINIPTKDALIVYYDEGGNIIHYISRAFDMIEQGRTVEIRGTCISACTVYLAVPGVCVAPDAVLGFHGALGIISGPEISGELTDKMAQMYPKRLRAWFYHSGAADKQIVYTPLTGAQVSRLGDIRLCEP